MWTKTKTKLFIVAVDKCLAWNTFLKRAWTEGVHFPPLQEDSMGIASASVCALYCNTHAENPARTCIYMLHQHIILRKKKYK